MAGPKSGLSVNQSEALAWSRVRPKSVPESGLILDQSLPECGPESGLSVEPSLPDA